MLTNGMKTRKNSKWSMTTKSTETKKVRESRVGKGEREDENSNVTSCLVLPGECDVTCVLKKNRA